MENDVDPDVIKATQNSLGKYVKRPPLTEKLLKKPPFRFLHDIVTAVIKNTGFLNGLFDQNELVSENFKDRESKIAFLTKVISVVAATTGNSLSAKPSKIVAGQEAEKTNILLQAIADALDRNLSSKEAVQIYRDSTKEAQLTDNNKSEKGSVIKKDSMRKNSDTKKVTSTEKVKTNNDKINIKDKKTAVSHTKDKDIAVTKEVNLKRNSQKKQKEKTEPIEKTSKNEKNVKKLKENLDKSRQPTDDVSKDVTKSVKEVSDNNSITSIENKEIEDSKHETTNEDIFNSSLSSTDLMVVNEQEKDEVLSESQLVDLNLKRNDDVSEAQAEQSNSEAINPTVLDIKKQTTAESDLNKFEDLEKNKENAPSESSRKSTPLKSENESNIVKTAIVRPSSSRPGAPRPREKFENVISEPDSILVGKVNIISENAPIEEEEDSSIVIVDEKNNVIEDQDGAENVSLTNGHGHLVQQILDSQKELSIVNRKTEIEWQFGAQKTRETTNQEVEKIRYNVQALSRAANPMGKLLDHLQEDVEIMRQELQQWTVAYEKTSKEVAKQKLINEESLLPLHTKLKQLDADIGDKHSKINDLKVIIQKNTSRIEKLLASGNVQ